MTMRHIQFYRNETIQQFTTTASAVSAAKNDFDETVLVNSDLHDGEILLYRYLLNSVEKAIIGVVRNDGENKTVTIMANEDMVSSGGGGGGASEETLAAIRSSIGLETDYSLDLSDDTSGIISSDTAVKDALIDLADYCDNGVASKSESIPCGSCNSTSTSTVFTATIDGITELKNGTIVLLKNGVIDSADTYTININGLGAKRVTNYMYTSDYNTTSFMKESTLLLVYDETKISGGCWVNYDSNTSAYLKGCGRNCVLPSSGITYPYRLVFTSMDDTQFVPANNTNSSDPNSSKSVTTTIINPWGSIYYYAHGVSVSNNNIGNGDYYYKQCNINLGYSFNVDGTALSLEYPKPVYVKCDKENNGVSIRSEEPIVQELPTSYNRKKDYAYIYLGIAYSSTEIALDENHPVYHINSSGHKQLYYGK